MELLIGQMEGIGARKPEGEPAMETGVEINRDYKNFLKLAFKLENMEPGTLMCDVDYVLRFPHWAIMRLRPGEIPESSLVALERLKDKGWKVVFVTNQPEKGHQIAKKRSRSKGYKAFPEALEEMFGKDAIIGGGADFLLKLSKSREGTVSRTVEWVRSHGIGHLAMVSDQIRDAGFTEKVYQGLSGLDYPGIERDGVTFYKIPGPPIG